MNLKLSEFVQFKTASTRNAWLIPEVLRGGGAKLLFEGAASSTDLALLELALSCSTEHSFFGQYQTQLIGLTTVVAYDPAACAMTVQRLRLPKNLQGDPERLRFVPARAGKDFRTSIHADTRFVIITGVQHSAGPDDNASSLIEMMQPLVDNGITVAVGTHADHLQDWADQRVSCRFEHLSGVLTLVTEPRSIRARVSNDPLQGTRLKPLPPGEDLTPVDLRVWTVLHEHDDGLQESEVFKYSGVKFRKTIPKCLRKLRARGLAKELKQRRGKRRPQITRKWIASLPEV